MNEWLAQDGPRERLLHLGSEVLSDAELIAVVLSTGARGCSALDMAHRLLSHCGGLKALLDAELPSVQHVHGFGPAKFARLRACQALGSRYARIRLRRGASIDGPFDAQAYFAQQLGHQNRELFACMYLDTRNRILNFEILFAGTIDGASVHPREIIKQVLRFNAAALIVGHNHPSGVAEPSAADRALTRRLQAATELMEVRLLDHLVVGEDSVISFAERGWL